MMKMMFGGRSAAVAVIVSRQRRASRFMVGGVNAARVFKLQRKRLHGLHLLGLAVEMLLEGKNGVAQMPQQYLTRGLMKMGGLHYVG
jgi:hypothetical protein